MKLSILCTIVALFLYGCNNETPTANKLLTKNVLQCSVTASTLTKARIDFAAQCPTATYRDCDPLGSDWMCSSVKIGPGGPEGAPVVTTADPVVVTPVDPVTPTQTSVTADTLGEAKNLFAQTFPDAIYRDCDPVGSQWTCSIVQIGPSGPAGGSGDVTDPIVTPIAVTPASGDSVRFETESLAVEGWQVSGDYSEWIVGDFFSTPPATEAMEFSFVAPQTASYQLRIRAIAVQQTAGRGDLHNDVWIKMDGDPAQGVSDVRNYTKVFISGDGTWKIGGNTDVSGEDHGPFRQELIGGRTYTLSVKGRSVGFGLDYLELFPYSTTVATPTDADADAPGVITFLPSQNDSHLYYADTFNHPYESGDLVVINGDFSYDPDDWQAWILMRELLNERPDVDYITVSGTKRRDHNSINPGATAYTQDLFPDTFIAFKNVGDEGACTRGNTTTFCQEAIDDVASYMLVTLNAGQRVHVADGGPSSFTADVILELIDRGIDQTLLRNIRVVQHSWGWNELYTYEDLDIIRAYADYVRISNGNNKVGNPNLTPDFSWNADDSRAAQFRALALSSQYSSFWQRALTILNNKTDGSDAVELMWILGVPTENADNLLEFADRYF